MIVNTTISRTISSKVIPAMTIARGSLPCASVTEPSQAQARAAIMELLEQRDRGKTICPSEAARALGGDEDFRELMPLVREAAAALAAEDEVEVTQSGRVVDVRTARGPVRLRRKP